MIIWKLPFYCQIEFSNIKMSIFGLSFALYILQLPWENGIWKYNRILDKVWVNYMLNKENKLLPIL